jgi:diadenosine tetraphosphate (Ap4A) HIT family hydrolase
MVKTESFDGKKTEADCLGCAIQTGKIKFPEGLVIEAKNFSVSQDYGFPIAGFFIVASRKHAISIADFSEQERKEFIELVCKMRKGMKEVLRIKEVLLFQNEGSSYSHFHLWLFPRYEWMEKFGKGTKSIKPILEHSRKSMKTKDNFRKIFEAVEKMRKYMKK